MSFIYSNKSTRILNGTLGVFGVTKGNSDDLGGDNLVRFGGGVIM